MKSKEEKETKKEREAAKTANAETYVDTSWWLVLNGYQTLAHTRLDCYLIPVLIPVLISVSDLIYQINTNISTY
jgi:hypothetical protein